MHAAKLATIGLDLIDLLVSRLVDDYTVRLHVLSVGS